MKRIILATATALLALTVATASATPTTAPRLPTDCGEGIYAPIVTRNENGTTTHVWPTNCRWISGPVALQDDPAFGSASGDTTGSASGE